MKLLLSPQTLLIFLCLIVFVPQASSAPREIVITGIVDPAREIPISVSGFSGVAHDVLRFDLEVLGFKLVGQDEAQFLLSGSSSGAELQGRLTDRNKASILSKAYTGTGRAAAHALANDVVSALRKTPPIFHTRIAFKVESGANSEIYLSDFDGYGAAPITADKSIVSAPAWAPKQNRVFYTSYKSGFPDIVAQDISSGTRQIFARYSGSNFSPAVSPDGRRVAMILSRSGSPDLYVCNIDGSNLRQLTKTKEDESSPCWSPDGRTICFVSRYGGRAALYTVPADGGEMRRLQTVGILNATEPDWSPDGKQIVFTAQMGGFNICTVDASGGEARILTSGEDPSWAPNSRTVIFTKRQNKGRILSLLDVPTKRVKDVRQISGSCSQPAWAK
jgi:TolB protein